jgi:predicted ATPase
MDSAQPLHKTFAQLMRDRQLTTLSLSLLSAEETIVLAHQVAGYSLDTQLANHLYQKTTGNPFFVIETVRAREENKPSIHEGTLSSLPSSTTEDALDGHPVPPKVFAVIQERLANLSPSARHVAQLAAIIGRVFSLELLAHANEEDEQNIVYSLEELWRRQIVREVDNFRFDFSHDQLRAATYCEINPVQRRLLHRRVAQALQALHADDLVPVAGELAGHCESAGLMEEALGYYRQAAGVAKQYYAYRDVVNYLEKALKILQSLPARRQFASLEIDVLHELGLASIPAYDYGNVRLGEVWRQAYELEISP